MAMTDAPQQVEAPASGLKATLSSLRRSLWLPIKRWTATHGDRWLPIIAAVLIVASMFFPYWRLTLNAPQYPNGLTATIGISSFSGDVDEIDGLNHYIGMRPLAEGGKFERSVAPFAVPLMAGIAALAAVRRRRFWLFALPAIIYPAVFTADLYYWLRDFGQNLDPTAALSSSFDEFTPTLLGPGRVGQFTTFSMYDVGFGMAFLGAVLLVIAVGVRVRRAPAEALTRTEAA